MGKRTMFTRGVFWNFADTAGTQLVNFFVAIILARLISPHSYGMLAIVFVFTGFLQLIASGGLSEAIIMKQEDDVKTIHSVFWYNLSVSIGLYFVFFAVSPLIALYYRIPELTMVLRVSGLTLPLWSLSNIQTTMLYKEVNFKRMFLLKVPGLLISSLIGVLLAYQNYGIWALVAQVMSMNLITTSIVFFISNYRPAFFFDYNKVRPLLSISGKFVISGIINKVFDSFYPLLIGKFYSLSQLGFYNRANATKDLLVNNLVQVVAKVGFPVFATMKEDKDLLRESYRKVMQVIFFFTFPLMFGCIVAAEPLIIAVYGKQWQSAIPYFQICCLIGMMLPLHVINLDILKVYAQSDTFLKLEIIKKTLLLIAIFSTYTFGVSGMLWGLVIVNFLSVLLNGYFCGRLIHYKLSNQFADLIPVFATSFSMAILMYLLHLRQIFTFPIAELIFLFMSGSFFYLALSWLIRVKPFVYLLAMVKKQVND